MQCSLNSLIGFTIGATDGEIGHVKDFYFDDNTWKVRYLIVKTGNWLSERYILISPDAMTQESREAGIFTARLTKEQVRNSPDIDTDMPVSRRQEIELYGHYLWEPYWDSGGAMGGFANIPQKPLVDESIINQLGGPGNSDENDPHLRSAVQVTGYNIHATDGDIGHVHDFILDDQTWLIPYLVVDTHNYIGGKKVLVAVGYVREIKWDEAKVIIDANVDAVRDSTADDKWKHNDLGKEPADNHTRVYQLNKEIEKFH